MLRANLKKVTPLGNSTANRTAANQDERPLSRSATNMTYQAEVAANESSQASDWKSMFGAI